MIQNVCEIFSIACKIPKQQIPTFIQPKLWPTEIAKVPGLAGEVCDPGHNGVKVGISEPSARQLIQIENVIQVADVTVSPGLYYKMLFKDILTDEINNLTLSLGITYSYKA